MRSTAVMSSKGQIVIPASLRKRYGLREVSVVNRGEVLYILLKHLDDGRASQHIRALRHAVAMIEAGVNPAVQAAMLKHRYKLG